MLVVLNAEMEGKTMKIRTEAKFSAAHVVHLTKTKCSRLHGHTWRVEVELEGSIDRDGMMVDFGDIKKVIDELDHKTLIPEVAIIRNVSGSLADQVFKGQTMVSFPDPAIPGAEKVYMFPPEDVYAIPNTPEMRNRFGTDVSCTAEFIAEHLIDKIAEITVKKPVKNIFIRVWESETSYAEASFPKM